MKLYLSIIALLSCFILHPIDVSLAQKEKNKNEKELTLLFNLKPGESILKQTLKISLDSPHATLSSKSFSEKATKQYLPEFKDTKDVFNKNFSVTTTAQAQTTDGATTKLYVSFLPLPDNKMIEKTFELSFQAQIDATNSLPSKKQTLQKPEISKEKSWVESFQDIVKTTESNWIRLLFAFLLGLLLSLTPCIYPMIPITIGILHRYGKKSLFHNFLGSFCYALGLSTTFAVFGLLAAFAGASFGGLLSQPIFVTILILFIGFMSLSMIGIVEIPMPKFMQGTTEVSPSRFGPFLSAFLFGVLSGTIASPCVSPGLALLLTIVATIGNLLAGFFLLFIFGLGMSSPLIIIGTFSTSLQMLPHAGQWMVEIKKLIGFVMLAMCFYYLNNILPIYVVMWLFVLYLLFAALFYIIDAQSSMDDKTKTIKSLIGIILLGITTFAIFKAYEATYPKATLGTKEIGVTWAKDYDTGLQQAKNQNKLLMLDFWANHCTICKAIERKIFDKHILAQELDSSIVFVKVDCTSSSNPDCAKLKSKYKVFAQPAILVVNPKDETILKKWSSEPYQMTPQEFIKDVQSIKA